MQEWLQFLQSKHSTPDTIIQNEKVIQFSEPSVERLALKNNTVICDLSHLGLLEISGADRMAFLQGQLTNDINLLTGSNAHYTGYCNPKGRLLALFLAFTHDERVHLQLPKELIESISKRLKMYVLRSKVTIEDTSERIIKIGINGLNAPELLQPLFNSLPQTPFDLTHSDQGTLLKLPGATPRFEIFTDYENAQKIWSTLAPDVKAVGAPCWEWLEIQAGIPDVTLKTQEEFVPQMLNLDLLGGINFKKGCYTGQEIVARTHYLGKVKRRTQLAHIASESAPEVGDDLYDGAQQAIGKIVRCSQSNDSGFNVLAECRLENLDLDGIFWNGIALTIQALPYALDKSA
jgi:folate-binding protein YgfZ